MDLTARAEAQSHSKLEGYGIPAVTLALAFMSACTGLLSMSILDHFNSPPLTRALRYSATCQKILGVPSKHHNPLERALVVLLDATCDRALSVVR